MIAFAIIVGFAFTAASIWLWIEAGRSAPSEDFGPDWDGHVKHICYRCKAYCSGPDDGSPATDRLCWKCYCRESATDDNPAVPAYVQPEPKS